MTFLSSASERTDSDMDSSHAYAPSAPPTVIRVPDRQPCPEPGQITIIRPPSVPTPLRVQDTGRSSPEQCERGASPRPEPAILVLSPMSNDPAPSERSISPMLSTIAIMPDPEPRSYSLFPQVGPKAPREWGVDDLAAFNIQFVEQDATAFYGPDVDLAPSSSVPREFLTAETSREAADPESKRLLRYMEFVRSVNIDDGACVMFLMRLLEAMGYPQAVGDDAVFVCEHEYPLTMYGQRFTGSCAMSIDAGEGRYPVIVHSRTMPVGDVDPRHPPVPHAKIVAMAIADYQYQADLAHRSSVLLLNSEYLRHDHAPRTYAAIMVTGTLPVFFKFTITTQLARAVAEGSMIDHPTVVQVYAPPVTKTNILETVASRCEDNIGLLGRRRLIVEAYELFRRHVVSPLRHQNEQRKRLLSGR